MAKSTMNTSTGYPGSTEIYTLEGWVPLKKLSTEKVAQINEDGNLTFVLPLNKYSLKYEGTLNHLYDLKGRLNITLGADQIMCYKTAGEIYERVKNNNITWDKNKKLLRSASINIDGPKDLTPHEKFLVAYQADGVVPFKGWSVNPDAAGYVPYVSLHFRFTKQRKIDRLISIAEECGYFHKTSQLKPPKNGNIPFDVVVHVPKNSVITKDFSWTAPLTRTKEWCQEFIKESSYWDATRQTATRFKYTTISESVIETLEDICMLAGYGQTYVYYDREGKQRLHSLQILLKHNHVSGAVIRKESIVFEGTMFNVLVPSGMILIRQNRKILICGSR